MITAMARKLIVVTNVRHNASLIDVQCLQVRKIKMQSLLIRVD